MQKQLLLRTVICAPLLAFALMGCDAAPKDEAAVAESLMAADRAYEETNRVSGFQAATANHMDFEQGFLIEPGQGFLRAREIILAERSTNAVPSPVHWAPEGAMGAKSDDLGITWGTFNIDGEPETTGHYLTVWRRDAAGEWKIVTDVALDDPPVAAPAAAASEGESAQ